MSPRRIDSLTDDQKARFDEWADKWIEVGLRTGPADRKRMEAAIRDCYKYAGIDFPELVIPLPDRHMTRVRVVFKPRPMAAPVGRTGRGHRAPAMDRPGR